MNSSDAVAVRKFVEAFHAATFDHERIVKIAVSLKAVQDRIDQAYSHICTDLPEINKGIHLTIRQATDTLDSLSISGPASRIDALAAGLQEFLKTLLRQSEHMRNATARSLEILETIDSRFPIALSLFENSFPQMEQPAGSGLEASFSAFTAIKDDLKEIMARSLRLQNEYREKIDQGKDIVIPSLTYTLNSVIDILRDLVSRANIMKNPILKIMSGLQTHDIVNQDITTVICGLKKMLNAEEITGGTEEIMDFLLFQEKASLLSLDLIVRLTAVIRAHGRDLEREISRIESTICHATEDKDALGDFFLLNGHSTSTFDIVSREITGMLEGLASAYDSLATLDSLQKAAVFRMVTACSDLESAAGDSACGIAILPVCESLSELSALTGSLARMTGVGTDVAELGGTLDTFLETRGLVFHNLHDIRRLLVESMEGIDVCSARCLHAIARFRQDIDDLMKTLDGSEIILDDLRNFNRFIVSIRTDIEKHISTRDRRSISRELGEIIYRLKNPHSNSLLSGDGAETRENRLTLF